MVSERRVNVGATTERDAEARVFGFALPSALAHLGAEIERSRAMLGLEDDWDDEGSPGYAETTWSRAIGFLVQNATQLWDGYGIAIEAPKVRKGPDGSIDLDWRTPHHELLVNVPADEADPTSYYGDDGAGARTIKGTLEPTANNRWLLMWLAE